MKQEFLLLKNSFKQIWRNKTQIIGVIILVLLSSLIFTMMRVTSNRIVNEYQQLNEKSNLHDFIFDFNNANYVKDDMHDVSNEEKEQDAVNNLSLNNNFIWSRIETRTVELSSSDGKTSQNKIIKAVMDQKAVVDKLAIIEGQNIADNLKVPLPNNQFVTIPAEQQIVINKEFANKNGIKIGTIIRLQSDILGSAIIVGNSAELMTTNYKQYNWFYVTGFGISADYETPIIDATTPLPNKKNEGIVYVDQSQFGLKYEYNKETKKSEWTYDKAAERLTIVSPSDRETYYVGKFLSLVNSNQRNAKVKTIADQLKSSFVSNVNISDPLVYALFDSNYKYSGRTSLIYETIRGMNILLSLLLAIVLIISGFTIILVTRKSIDNVRVQIGILKALGYSAGKILITSLVVPLIGSLIGCILVWIPATFLQIITINAFKEYFNLNFGGFVIDGMSFIYCLILTFGFLGFISLIIAYFAINHNPIELIKAEMAVKLGNVQKSFKNAVSKTNFNTRFCMSIFVTSFGKMFSVALTMLLGTILMTISITGPNILKDNLKASYAGMNYKTMTTYDVPLWNSPYSMYKTYDPEVKETFNRTNALNDIYNNKINADYYAPDTDNIMHASMEMANLTWKSVTKHFLSDLDQTPESGISPIVCQMAWHESIPMANLTKAVKNNDQSAYSLENYKIARDFYLTYRNGIDLNVNPKYIKNSHIDWTMVHKDSSSFKEFNWANYSPSASKNYDIFNQEALIASAVPPSISFQQNWIQIIATWYHLLFDNRAGQCVTQGMYIKTPYFVREELMNAYNDPNNNFGVNFNVVPYSNQTDELGTYFNANEQEHKNYDFTVYGLAPDSHLMQLYNSSNVSLNSQLFVNDNSETVGINNMIINQTLAKKFGYYTGEILPISIHIKQLEQKESGIYQPILLTNEQNNHWLKDSINFGNDNNNVNLLYGTLAIGNLSNEMYNVSGATAPSEMAKELKDGKIRIANVEKTMYFKVAGIYNGYGAPSAYVSQQTANKAINLDKTSDFNYQAFFQKEWNEVTQKVNNIEINFKNNFSQYPTLLSLKIGSSKDPTAQTILRIFNNEYPTFNFKYSASTNIADITNSLSTSNPFGDYTAIGMNGGLADDGLTYNPYQIGSTNVILPIGKSQAVLNQITQVVTFVLLTFAAFAIIISFVIILLTSNLIIYENRKTIATMKVLGYSDLKITRIVLGMYIPIIIFMFILGFAAGWGIITLVVDTLAVTSAWVLPLIFAWWLVPAVMIFVFGIYITSFAFGWNSLKKVNPLYSLNVID